MFARKLIPALFIGAVLALLFTGCSGKKETAKTDGPVTLTIMSSTITEKPEGELEKAMADAYMKLNPNIKIEYVGQAVNEMGKKIITLSTSDSLPDAFFCPTEFMAQAEQMNIAADLNTILDKEYIAGFVPGLLKDVTFNNKMVMFPWFCAPMAVLYRADWFQAAGLKPPANWDEFLKAAQTLTRDTNGDGKTDQWGFSMVGTRNGSGENRFIGMVRTWGVDDIRMENGKWVSDIGTPKYNEGLQYFVDLNNKYGVVPPGAVETGYPEAANFFATGKTAMMVTGSNAIGVITSQNPDLEGKIGSFMIPKKERYASALGVGGYVITSSSKHKKEMADYLKFLADKDNAINFSIKTGRLPSRTENSSNEALNNPTYIGFIESMNYPYPAPGFSAYSEILDIQGEAYTTMMGNKVPLDKAVATAKERLAKVLAENNK